MASPPPQEAAWYVLPVATNGSTPSLATPPTDQIPPLLAVVAQAMTLDGLLSGTPTTQPKYVSQSPHKPP